MPEPSSRPDRRHSLQDWFPVLLRYTGLAGVPFVAVVWLLTDRISGELIALFTTLLGLGEGTDALRDFIRTRPTPPDLRRPDR